MNELFTTPSESIRSSCMMILNRTKHEQHIEYNFSFSFRFYTHNQHIHRICTRTQERYIADFFFVQIYLNAIEG